jgi:hypothetical protein
LAVIPLEGLVGVGRRHSSGKTNTLEAVAELITLARKERRPWGGDGQTQPEGLVSFELDQADVSGHPDAELYRQLLTGAFGLCSYKLFDDESRERLRDATPAEIQEHMAEQLLEAGTAGAAGDRRLLAKAMTRTTSVTGDYTGTELTVLPDRLSNPAREAARRLAAAPNPADQADFLLTAATELSQGRPVGISPRQG